MVSYILNTILQIIECFICFSFYENISNTNKGYIRRLFIMMCSYIVMGIINIVFNYNVAINIALLVVFHTLFAFCLYKQKILFSLIYSATIAATITITEISVINLVAVVFKTNSKSFIENPLNYIIVIVFSKTGLFIILKIIGDIINRYRQNEKVSFVFLLYPFSLLFVIISFVFLSYEYNLNNNMKILVSVSIIVLIVSVIFTCFYQQLSSKRDKELIELKASQQKQELDNTYFELLSHQNEELQIFVHDTKNHLNNIYNLLDSSNLAKDYITNIVDDINSVNRVGKTSNKLLDLIIDKYSYICDKHNILFITNIHKSNLEFISNNDLTSLFNNLLDNAVEAAKVSDEKRISLNINIIGNMLHIEVANSCDKPPVSYNKILISTKDNKQLHGYGFKSITRTVKKYKGDIEWDYDDKQKEFIVSILLAYNNL